MFISLFLTNVLLTALFILFLKRIVQKRKIMMSQEIPVIGGIGMGLSFLVTFSSYLFFSRTGQHQLSATIIASLVMLLFGILDDLKELSVLKQFMVQVIATSVLVFFGVRTNIAHIGILANIVITYIWVIGITNSINLLDVMDGVAGAVTLVISLSFCAISLLTGQIAVTILSLTLSGMVAGFLFFNLPKARVYMGNSGSHFLGFLLAAIAIMISYSDSSRRVALFSPLLILGFPIFDTLFLIMIRLIKGKSAFNKSNDHLVLRMLKVGYSKKKALFLMAAITFFFAVAGIVVSRSVNALALVVVLFMACWSILLAFKMGRVVIE